LRRPVLLAAIAAALVSAVPAGAELMPVRREAGEVVLPRVRPGKIEIPAGHARGRITVLVGLRLPPLSGWHRDLQGTAGRAKLDTATAASRAHLARLARAQRRAESQLRRAIPEARVRRRYRIVLDALAVELPATRLPTLVRQAFAAAVYPSLRYTLATNASPAIIGADALRSPGGGGSGEGIKIAVVDDGVDPTNPFFDPAGFRYPPGFPKGGTKWTSQKVIVARAFPGPGSGRPGRLAVDPRASFHGTHVAGIAAGKANTTAPAGNDHPRVEGLSGVAPRAWIGNYRVFTVPTPIGNVANTPEIVAAFEAAVRDGMDVINFSGGGPQTDPETDALNQALANVAAAGLVPVISAGNDRDEFGGGTAGSPGTAPEAISVAALSNSQVFSQTIEVRAGDAPSRVIPFRPAPGGRLPGSWATADQTLIDAASLGADPFLCGPPGNPNGDPGPLPARSADGAIVLALRGRCTFVAKARHARTAGAAGIVLVDNRPGEANVIPVGLALPGGMISDLDGARLRGWLAGRGGRAPVRISSEVQRIATGRSGILTSFSSAGPTAFGHDLKPDVAAPGGQILSATLPSAGGPFAVFDGTSMAAPHVAGAAALLLERHPGWTSRQVKSALASTAGPAWADSARTVEAPVTLEGGGLVDLRRAVDPLLFTDPVSLSFPDLNVNHGARSAALLTRVADAGSGGGPWQVGLQPQAASRGATLELPATIELPPGGDAPLVAVARAAADAEAGENYGFVVLGRGGETRRIPYFFLVERPGLEALEATELRAMQEGTTASGESRVSSYRYPTAPFGHPPNFVGPPMEEDGGERLYTILLERPAVNFGVAVIAGDPNSVVDPWVLGSKDENDVQGYAGTPVNVNALTFGYRLDIGVAGASLPRPGRYYVSVDSGRDQFTGRRLAGRYVLQAWVDDVFAPFLEPVTTRVSAGRPTLVARVLDGIIGPGSGVDPVSLVLGYQGVLVGAAFYDPFSGLAIFPLPDAAPALRAGRTQAILAASDNQEAKNVNTGGEDVLPNTAFRSARLRVVAGPTATWLAPEANECLPRRAQLTVVAGSPARIRSVSFFDRGRRVAAVRRGVAGLYTATWRPRGKGQHRLRAVVRDVTGRTAAASRPARVCR
jgi:minor extracellular serine protease Vpr